MFTGLESPTHIVMLLLLASLLFGAKRLPEIGRSLGAGIREFKQSITGTASTRAAEIEEPLDSDESSGPLL